MSNRKDPVIVEQIFNKSAVEVWKAITQVDQMTKWFFENIETFVPEVGFETRFNVKTPNADFLHIWKMVEVIPNKKIVYDWSYEGYKGRSNVSFELFEKEDTTRLRVTHDGLDTYDSDVPEFTRESCEGGWNYFIRKRLKEFLD